MATSNLYSMYQMLMVPLLSLSIFLYSRHVVWKIVSYVRLRLIVCYVYSRIFYNLSNVSLNAMLGSININDTVCFSVPQIHIPFSHHINAKHAYLHALLAHHKRNAFHV